ncbi:MAG: hypothetical protein WB791_07180 [Waddliaceae bacterium]
MKGIPEPEEITKTDLILSANRALLSLIHPNMREIDIEYIKEKKTINFCVYFDLQPTDNQKDDVGNMVTEMSCQFTDDIQWEEEIIFLPYPERIPQRGICVFRRYEPLPPGVNKKDW